ncbi:hypothetical protein GCM10010329_32460 [Streptomyces spiroverticillatus]|uniref:Uncharacterized protein n=1 Tax=Streptomyces finlayi TaxID=67296 RepID=A0A918WWK1_9ACTN|nr:hypothetical protein GCM10010329_32460 [Streptomyces spiroverticillatus]GHC90676.1 hypothetical protein GCM10010334_24870 [Streptomyces finlayi]
MEALERVRADGLVDGALPRPTQLLRLELPRPAFRGIDVYAKDESAHPTGSLAGVDAEHSAYFPSWASNCPDHATGVPSRVPGIGRPRTEPGFVPDVIDLVVPVPDAAALAASAWIRRSTGIEAGPATGANVWAVCHLAARIREADTRGSVATLVGDRADPYRVTHLDARWVRGRGLEPGPHEVVLDRFGRTGVRLPTQWCTVEVRLTGGGSRAGR